MKSCLYEKTKLGRYLLSKGESAYDFYKRSKLSLTTIYKMLRGDVVRIDTARRVVRVTKKELVLDDIDHKEY